jgi:hypothetical protein
MYHIQSSALAAGYTLPSQNVQIIELNFVGAGFCFCDREFQREIGPTFLCSVGIEPDTPHSRVRSVLTLIRHYFGGQMLSLPL